MSHRGTLSLSSTVWTYCSPSPPKDWKCPCLVTWPVLFLSHQDSVWLTGALGLPSLLLKRKLVIWMLGVGEAWLKPCYPGSLCAVFPFQEGLTLGGMGTSSLKRIWSLFLQHEEWLRAVCYVVRQNLDLRSSRKSGWNITYGSGKLETQW